MSLSLRPSSPRRGEYGYSKMEMRKDLAGQVCVLPGAQDTCERTNVTRLGYNCGPRSDHESPRPGGNHTGVG